MKLRFFGHSAFQLEVGDQSILIDPFITGNPLAEGIATTDELSPDTILLTHAHGDHWGDTPAIAKRTGALVVSNFEITQYLAEKYDHENIQPMNTGGSVDLGWGRVTNTWARHSSSFPDGTYGGNPGGFMIEAGGICLYVAGDTSPFAEMAWMGEDFDIDVALLPIGDCFTMGIEGSIRAANLLKPGRIIPCHYDTFPPIETDTAVWSARMKAAGHTPHVLLPGQTLDL
jgi:L-ascorbate metabolism protein UlaG (beta-lactamase superfamily)